jgi:hypothetical protein
MNGAKRSSCFMGVLDLRISANFFLHEAFKYHAYKHWQQYSLPG